MIFKMSLIISLDFSFSSLWSLRYITWFGINILGLWCLPLSCCLTNLSSSLIRKDCSADAIVHSAGVRPISPHFSSPWLLPAQTLTQKFVQEIEKPLQNPKNLQKEKLGIDFLPKHSYGRDYFDKRIKSEDFVLWGDCLKRIFIQGFPTFQPSVLWWV